jgi:hypothetical protein
LANQSIDKEAIAAHFNAFKDMSDRASKRGKGDDVVYFSKASKWLETAREQNPQIYWKVMKVTKKKKKLLICMFCVACC